MILVLTTEAGDFSHPCFIDWLNYYNADYIYTDLLCEISEILDEDFFAFYSQSLMNNRNLKIKQ
ncbi:MAG: hypothetical protein LBT29_09350 [Flavobacteriaceae bacterium]|jgi:hypothetical protein|nr:hypothetical protein [Flavobacteriaceae bacterium]